ALHSKNNTLRVNKNKKLLNYSKIIYTSSHIKTNRKALAKKKQIFFFLP
ncbi:hypothetical protein M5D96_010634, partial [Drosophila gunungcola]